jgi:hypothetical protein
LIDSTAITLRKRAGNDNSWSDLLPADAPAEGFWAVSFVGESATTYPARDVWLFARAKIAAEVWQVDRDCDRFQRGSGHRQDAGQPGQWAARMNVHVVCDPTEARDGHDVLSRSLAATAARIGPYRCYGLEIVTILPSSFVSEIEKVSL